MAASGCANWETLSVCLLYMIIKRKPKGGEKLKSIYREFGIYRITNMITGESYVGQTGVNFGDRWDSHRALLRAGRNDNPPLQKAWNEYGESAFEFAIIESVSDKSLLNSLEIQYISEYRAEDKSYNIADGGDIPYFLGRPLSEDARRRIGEKNRINMTGRKLSAETRKKMSESHLNRVWTDEQRQRQSENSRIANTGRVRSAETRELLRKINQENPPSAKITPDDVRNIRRRYADGETQTAIAKDFELASGTISNIVNRKRWAHVD